jgi:pimeloyl-ACP methyl ester carboxylesterase
VSTAIPFEDWGGRGPALLFAPANGYPAGSYRLLLEALAAHYRVIGVRHRPLWPGSRPEALSSWHDIADDLIALADQERLRDVIAVGHSLGAVTLMMASLRRPKLARCLALIEPVFLAPSWLQALAAAERDGRRLELSLVETARNRRSRWPSRQAAFDRFRGKAVFAGLSDEALWDYVWAGTRESATGDVELAYPTAWEARIYSLPPADVWELLPLVSHPTLGIRAAGSDTINEEAWESWRRVQPGAWLLEFPDASHLLPMERPLEVAAAVKEFAAGWGDGAWGVTRDA